MPGPRRLTKSDEAIALDEAARAFTRIQNQLDAQREKLHAACVAAVRSGMSKSEVGRRAGYSREYIASLVDKADEAEHSTKLLKRPEVEPGQPEAMRARKGCRGDARSRRLRRAEADAAEPE